MKEVFFVGCGSFLGGAGRYLLSTYVLSIYSRNFPLGTLSVNFIGCFLIGLVIAMSEKLGISQTTRLFLTTGVLGGFTTFSAFSYETVALMRQGNLYLAMLNILLSTVICLTAVWLGIKLAN